MKKKRPMTGGRGSGTERESRISNLESRPALSPEKAGVLRIINASEEFGVAIPELAARVAGAGVHLSEAAIQVAAAALCDLGEVVLAGEPPRYFGKKFRPQI